MREPRGVICGSHYIEVKQPVRECPTCQRRRRFLIRFEAWRGAYWVCLTCGERFHSDEGRLSRPFMPGWRAKSIKEAKQFWREYGRVRFSMRRLLST